MKRGRRSRAPRAHPLEAAGPGLEDCSYGKGKGEDTITSGLEGAWTSEPDRWTSFRLFRANLFNYEWELTKSPAGAISVDVPKDGAKPNEPGAGRPRSRARRHAPIMFTTDLALRDGSRSTTRSPSASTRTRTSSATPSPSAWFKLTHRDMGPRVPATSARRCSDEDSDLAGSGARGRSRTRRRRRRRRPSKEEDPRFRADDLRARLDGLGLGLDLPRKRQARWRQRCTHPARAAEGLGRERARRPELARSSASSRASRRTFNDGLSRRISKVSLADLIVLGGCAGIEKAAKDAGHDVSTVPFTPGRTDATQEMTDIAVLQPCSSPLR